jgi:hypothetical protein
MANKKGNLRFPKTSPREGKEIVQAQSILDQRGECLNSVGS